MRSELVDLSLIQIADLIARREVSAVEATTACLEQISLWNGEVNAFIAVEADEALETARKLDEELVSRGPRGRLHGVPMAHKDIYYRSGRVTSAGSVIFRNWIAPATSTALERLDRAGAVTLGRLNLGEFSANPTGQNDTFGDCRNAWNPNHVSGGSSSGSAVALATRMVFGSLGSDTGGSARIPAAANGIVGLAPTRGLVSRFGVFPRSQSFDRVGPMARTVLDCARITEVVAGYDARDDASDPRPVPPLEKLAVRSIKGLRIGIPDEGFIASADPEITNATTLAGEILRSAGAELSAVHFPNLKEIYDLNEWISGWESGEIHARWMKERPNDYPPYILARFSCGEGVPRARYDEAMQRLAQTRAAFLEAVFGKVDAILCPTLPIPVPTWDVARLTASDSPNWKTSSLLSSLTRLSNTVDVPAISVPCGFTQSGLPMAFQVMGRPYEEGTIFSIAHTYESQCRIRAPRQRLPGRGSGA